MFIEVVIATMDSKTRPMLINTAHIISVKKLAGPGTALAMTNGRELIVENSYASLANALEVAL